MYVSFDFGWYAIYLDIVCLRIGPMGRRVGFFLLNRQKKSIKRNKSYLSTVPYCFIFYYLDEETHENFCQWFSFHRHFSLHMLSFAHWKFLWYFDFMEIIFCGKNQNHMEPTNRSEFWFQRYSIIMVCCISDIDKNTLNTNMHFLFIMYLFFKFLVQNCKLGI